MSANRFMTTVVCDDVRKEQGNKLSYMGIYSGDIFVPRFPFTMPKLCFVLTIVCPGEEDPPEAITFRLMKDDDVVAEMVIPPENLAAAREQAQGEAVRASRRHMIGTVLQIFPFSFVGPCVLKARAICDGEEIKGGSWLVQQTTQQMTVS